MEDPVREIKPLFCTLIAGTEDQQKKAIQDHFLSDAALEHPLCRVDRFFFPIASRDVIQRIYRFHKFMSQQIEIDVQSVAYDEDNAKLYVTAEQKFTFWFMPWHQIRVSLISALDLHHEHENTNYADALKKEEDKPVRWYIKKQSNLYQSDQWVAFLPFLFPGGATIIRLLRRLASISIVFLVLVGHLFHMLFRGVESKKMQASERFGKRT